MDNKRPRSGWTRVPVALALALVSLGTAAVIAEGFARLLHQPEPVRRVWDPFAYRIPAPSLVDAFTGLEGKTVTVRLDDRGMRRWSSDPQAPGAPLRLVFLGGSTTENYAYANAVTFPVLVGQAVADACGRQVEVRNAGASAATVAVTLGRLQHQVLDLAPDLVVVMHGINDLYAGFQPGYRSDQRHLIRPPGAGTRPRSFLIDWLRRRRRAGSPAPADLAPPVVDWTAHPSFPPYVSALRSVAAVADAHGVPLLLVTQPTTYGAGFADHWLTLARVHRRRGAAIPGADSLAEAMAVFNRATRQIAGHAGVPLVELARTMPIDKTHFIDDCHFSVAGNQAVAERLAPSVVELLGCAAGRAEGAGPV